MKFHSPRLIHDGKKELTVSWKPFLTVTNRYNLSVKATPPKIDLVFHNPREGLGVSDDLQDFLSVQTKTDMKIEFEDDGISLFMQMMELNL